MTDEYLGMTAQAPITTTGRDAGILAPSFGIGSPAGRPNLAHSG